MKRHRHITSTSTQGNQLYTASWDQPSSDDCERGSGCEHANQTQVSSAEVRQVEQRPAEAPPRRSRSFLFFSSCAARCACLLLSPVANLINNSRCPLHPFLGRCTCSTSPCQASEPHFQPLDPSLLNSIERAELQAQRSCCTVRAPRPRAKHDGAQSATIAAPSVLTRLKHHTSLQFGEALPIN